MGTTPACFACGQSNLEVFHQVDKVPVHSCVLLDSREEALRFPTGCLEMAVCHTCGFIQNRAFDPSLQDYLTTSYEDTQTYSPRFRQFQTALCREQIAKHDLRGKTVLEIGCGRATFLMELCTLSGGRGIGIDPSCLPERVQGAVASKLEFIRDYYSENYAHLGADYVCCRHTLEHIQDVGRFVRTVRHSLQGHLETIVFFEVPDAERVLETQAFWDIYYEHCSYFSPTSLQRLFESSGFETLDVYKAFDDQYLIIEARPAAGWVEAAEGAVDNHDIPTAASPETLHQVCHFQERVGARCAELRGRLDRHAARGEQVVIWGSGSKAVSLLTTLEVADEVGWVVDINPHRHGKFLAQTGHQIVAPGFLKTHQPDAVIVMNRAYTQEIRADLSAMGLHPELVAL